MGKFKKGDSVTKINTNTPIMKVISVRKGKIKCEWKITENFDLENLILQMKAVKINPSPNTNQIEQGDYVIKTDKNTLMYVSNMQNNKVTCEFLQTEIFNDYLLQYPPSLQCFAQFYTLFPALTPLYYPFRLGLPVH